MIRTDSDEYFIEPLERGAQELEDHGRVHVVYRRSALLKPPSDISVDYQLQGRTMIVMGSCNSPQGGITSTPSVAMCVMTLFYPTSGWLEWDFYLCVNWGAQAIVLEFFKQFWGPKGSQVIPQIDKSAWEQTAIRIAEAHRLLWVQCSSYTETETSKYLWL